MKTIPRISLIILGVFMIALSCKQAEETAEAQSVSEEAVSSATDSAPSPNPQLPSRKFIRTANLKFSVKNVSQSTDAIENAARLSGGYVASSELESIVQERISTKISQDSTLETTKYSVENSISLRVPNTQFDTVIRKIATEIAFLDSRNIKADDVALQLLSQAMAQKRSSTHQKRLEKAIDTKGSKLNQIADAEDRVYNAATDQDNKKIEALSLQDQVNFSTITLKIYQRETMKQEVIANQKDGHNYEPALGLRLLDAIKSGWYIVENLLVFVLRLWSLILLGILIFIAIKRLSKK